MSPLLIFTLVAIFSVSFASETTQNSLHLDKTSTQYHLSVLERLRPTIVSMQPDLSPAEVKSLDSARYHSDHVAGLVGGLRRAAYSFTLASGQSCQAEVNILSPSSTNNGGAEEQLHLKVLSCE